VQYGANQPKYLCREQRSHGLGSGCPITAGCLISLR
jgi:hypothetical protein